MNIFFLALHFSVSHLTITSLLLRHSSLPWCHHHGWLGTKTHYLSDIHLCPDVTILVDWALKPIIYQAFTFALMSHPGWLGTKTHYLSGIHLCPDVTIMVDWALKPIIYQTFTWLRQQNDERMFEDSPLEMKKGWWVSVSSFRQPVHLFIQVLRQPVHLFMQVLR